MSRETDNWRFRAIRLTRGNSTPLGALVLAVIGRNARNPPWFGNAAEITVGGQVVTSFTDRAKRMHFPHVLGTVDYLTSTFSRLADELKLADEERIELFRMARQWCVKDHRPDNRLHFTGERAHVAHKL